MPGNRSCGGCRASINAPWRVYRIVLHSVNESTGVVYQGLRPKSTPVIGVDVNVAIAADEPATRTGLGNQVDLLLGMTGRLTERHFG